MSDALPIDGEAIFDLVAEPMAHAAEATEAMRAQVKALTDAELLALLEWLEGPKAGAECEVWAACTNEGKDRWMKDMKGDREG